MIPLAGPGYRASASRDGLKFETVDGGRAALQTVAIARGGVDRSAVRDVAAAPTRAGAPRAAAIAHDDGIVERFEARPSGVEHAYTFAHAPEGDGDLVIRLAADQPEVPLSGGQHVFRAPGVHAGVVYGEATWVDARGARTPVEVASVAGGVRLRVPARVLDASTYPAVLDPLISPETALDGPIQTQGSSGTQTAGVPASTSTVSLLPMVTIDAGITSRVAVRVDASGAVLDAQPIVLETDLASNATPPRAATDGTNFLVFNEPETVRRVTAGGQVLDPGGLSAVGWTRQSSVVFAAGTYWYTTSQRSVRRLDATGAPVGAEFTFANAQIAGSSTPLMQLAVSGNTILALWTEANFGSKGTYVARFDATAPALDAAPVAMSGCPSSVSTLAAAANGATFAVACSACVATTGVTGPVGTPVCGSESVSYLFANGSEWVASTGNGSWRLASNLLRLTSPDKAGVQSAAPGGFIGEVVRSGSTMVTFNRLDALLATLGTANQPLHSNLVPVANIERVPEVVSSPTGHYVAWWDSRSPPGIYGMRVDLNGQQLDASASLILAATPTYEPFGLASDGAGGAIIAHVFNVVHVTADGVVHAPVTLPQQAGPGPIGGEFISEQIARGPGGYMYALTTNSFLDSYPRVYGFWLDANLNVTAGPAYLADNPGSVGSDGSTYLLVSTRCSPAGPPSDVCATLYGAAAQFIAQTQIQPATGAYWSWITNASIVSAGGAYVVIAAGSGAVQAQRVNATNAQAIDYPPVNIGPAGTFPPFAAFDGTNIWAAWAVPGAHDVDILGVRLTPGLVKVDDLVISADTPTPPRSSGFGDEADPWMSFTGDHGLAVYAYKDPADGMLTYRIRSRVVRPGGCTNDLECAGGVCVSGQCVASTTASSAATTSASTGSAAGGGGAGAGTGVGGASASGAGVGGAGGVAAGPGGASVTGGTGGATASAGSSATASATGATTSSGSSSSGSSSTASSSGAGGPSGSVGSSNASSTGAMASTGTGAGGADDGGSTDDSGCSATPAPGRARGPAAAALFALGCALVARRRARRSAA